MSWKYLPLMSLLFVFCCCLSHAKKKESDGDDFWDRTKQGTKRIFKGVGKAGKEVGRGFQEIFDPEDEDLQKEQKQKKKDKDNEED